MQWGSLNKCFPHTLDLPTHSSRAGCTGSARISAARPNGYRYSTVKGELVCTCREKHARQPCPPAGSSQGHPSLKEIGTNLHRLQQEKGRDPSPRLAAPRDARKTAQSQGRTLLFRTSYCNAKLPVPSQYDAGTRSPFPTLPAQKCIPPLPSTLAPPSLSLQHPSRWMYFAGELVGLVWLMKSCFGSPFGLFRKD